MCRQDQLRSRTGCFGAKSALGCIYESSLFTQAEAICIISTRLALLYVPRGITDGNGLANEQQRCAILLSGTYPSGFCWVHVISPMCSESLQAFVSVLSRVDAGEQVEAPPSAAAASASGINPVSTEASVNY